MNNIKLFKHKIKKFNSIWNKIIIPLQVLIFCTITYSVIDVFYLHLFSEDTNNWLVIFCLLFVNITLLKDFWFKHYLFIYKDKIDNESLEYLKRLSNKNIIDKSAYNKLYYYNVIKNLD